MLSKKRQEEIFAMKTVAYCSACGGIEIKKIEYGIEDKNACRGKRLERQQICTRSQKYITKGMENFTSSSSEPAISSKIVSANKGETPCLKQTGKNCKTTPTKT